MSNYEIPSSLEELFKEVGETGSQSYSIVNYEDGMDMDNIQSMTHFAECLGISDENIEEDEGTQLTIKHSDYDFKIVVDAGGLGDFFSHSFDCEKIERG